MNPILPLNICIPDGEPHVFGDRVYLYGSHDKLGGERFCMEDYYVYSAPVDDLTNWTTKGVAFKRSDDPRSKDNKLIDMYAPDCVKGNDGRYYLYYFVSGPNAPCAFGEMSVAVSDFPDGPFKYLGDIKDKNGKPVLTYLTNDPAVINDNGKIYLYYGWGLMIDFRSKLLKPLFDLVLSKLGNRSKEVMKNTKPSILSCACVELEDDMMTVKSEPHAVLDSLTTANKKDELYKHPFYEAASIRKFDDIYYLIYSSGKNNELAYATSKYPDRDFKYSGVLVSNSDLGLNENKKMKMAAGTIHGSVEKINGKYYVFYHRSTQNTDFSRQACIEPIEMKNHLFKQAEITTCGVSGPLKDCGTYNATLCCNLFNSKTKNVQGYGKKNKQTCIDYANGVHYIKGLLKDTYIGYKYFDFKNAKTIALTLRKAKGEVIILLNNEIVGKTYINYSEDYKKINIDLNYKSGIKSLFILYKGNTKADFLEMELI